MSSKPSINRRGLLGASALAAAGMPVATLAQTDCNRVVALCPPSSGPATDLIVSALSALRARGGGTLELSGGVFSITSSIDIPDDVVVRGSGRRVTRLVGIGGLPYVISLGTRCAMQSLGVEASGDAVKIRNGAGLQSLLSCRLASSAGSALSIDVNSGAEFSALACTFVTYDDTRAAVRVGDGVGADGGAVPRHFTNCSFEGAEIACDFSGANDTFLTGGWVKSIKTSPLTSKLMVTNVRFGAQKSGAAFALYGENNSFVGCVISGRVVLYCKDSIFYCINSGYDIQDSGTGNSVHQRFRGRELSGGYQPEWRGAVDWPRIGNGSVSATYARQGGQITVFYDISFGSTTSFGVGAWRFSLPRRGAKGLVQVVGSGFTQGGGARDFLFTPRLVSDNDYVELFAVNQNGALMVLGADTQAWSSQGNLRFSFSYVTE